MLFLAYIEALMYMWRSHLHHAIFKQNTPPSAQAIDSKQKTIFKQPYPGSVLVSVHLSGTNNVAQWGFSKI